MVGGGIASMAAAAFLIRDAGVPGENIHILETLNVPGGSLDGAESPVGAGYVTRGGRMLEDEAYRCLWNLLETIPDRDDPSKSARQGIIDFNCRITTHAHARLIDSGHEILDAAAYGFSTRDRMELTRLLALSEHALGARRIDEMFSRHFFETNFWQMWRTTFAFQNWHSAIELRRYFIRFVQEFPRIHTLSGVRRTVYNQYDSIVVPLQKWMLANYVDVRFGVTATDADFADEGGHRRAVKLYYTEKGEGKELDLGENDYLFMTLGSITADSSYGGQTSVPELIRDRRDGPRLRAAKHVLRKHRREQVGVVHPHHAQPHAAGPDHQVLRRRTGYRSPDDVGGLRLADVDRRSLPAALPRHARGHLHPVGLRAAHR
jgi:oleate hydratase